MEFRRAAVTAPEVRDFLQQRGGAAVARREELVDVLARPAIVATDAGAVAGVLTYDVVGDSCEILTLHAARQWSGVGSAMVIAVAHLAAAAGYQLLGATPGPPSAVRQCCHLDSWSTIPSRPWQDREPQSRPDLAANRSLPDVTKVGKLDARSPEESAFDLVKLRGQDRAVIPCATGVPFDLYVVLAELIDISPWRPRIGGPSGQSVDRRSTTSAGHAGGPGDRGRGLTPDPGRDQATRSAAITPSRIGTMLPT